MSACPSREDLQKFLAEQLSDALRKTIETHVDACATCLETLARLSDEGGEVASRMLHTPSSTPPLASEADFLEYLKGNPPLPAEPAEGSEPIEFPGPPTDKGPLGQLGPFAIRKELGAGRFGVVYQAYDELGRLVAIKVLRPELAASCKERAHFVNEARKGAAVKHDHIVIILQVGHTPDFPLPYLVMEYIDGEALSERLQRQGVLEAREAARIVRQMALALVAAHKQGLVHRDIKPSNILLEAGTGRAKLADFGLARVTADADGSTIQSGRIVGTLAYISAEQITAPSIIDARSDLYSLGVVLYELLAGERPFRAVTHHLLLQQVVHDEPRPPRKLNDAIPRDLQTITLKCLAKDPGRRYQSAGELADDLERWLDGKPIQARPVGVAGKVQRWCRRKPALAAVSSLALAAMVATVVVSVWLAIYMSNLASEKLRRVAELNFGNGLMRCTQGEVSEGMLWLAHTLQLAPPDLEDDIRTNLAGWRPLLSTLETVLPHDTEVEAVGFGSDGQTILTGCFHQTQKWESTSGKRMGSPLQHPREFLLLAFSPDGKTIVTRGKESVQLWETDAEKAISVRLAHARVHLAAFSPDGSCLLTLSDQKSLQLWKVADGKPKGPRILLQELVNAVAVSPDGNTILTGSNAKTAQLWDAVVGKPLGGPLEHRSEVQAVAFSPDGNIVLTGSKDGTAQLWEVASRRPIGFPLPHEGSVTAVGFSPDGQILFTTENIKCRLWQTASGKPLGSPLQHRGMITRVSFSPDGKMLLTGSADKTVRLWKVASAEPPGITLNHRERVQVAVFSPDGKTVLTISGKTVRLWDAATGKPFGHSFEHLDTVLAAAFSHDGKTIVTGSMDNTERTLLAACTVGFLGSPRGQGPPLAANALISGVKTARLWDVTTGRLIHALPHQHGIVSVAFSHDDNAVLTGSYDGSAQLWDARTGEPLVPALQHKDQDTILAVALSPQGDTLLTAGADGTAQLWDARTGRRVLPHHSWVFTAVFSLDGKKVLTASADGTAQVWDSRWGLRRGSPLRHRWGMVFAAAFSPDGHTVVTAGEDHVARLWETDTGNAIGDPLQHHGPVRRAAFSPDGRLVVTGSDDKTARLWHTATGRPFGPPLPHRDRINSVAFSPDGKAVLTASDDRSARIWQLPIPMGGPRDRILHWMKVSTGMEIGKDNSVYVMDEKTWRKNQ